MFKSKLFAAAILATSVVTVPLAASAAPVTIKVAYENHPGEPTDKVMNYWADLLEERSDGEIILELYPSSQLGSKGDVMDQAMMGMNVVTITEIGRASCRERVEMWGDGRQGEREVVTGGV